MQTSPRDPARHFSQHRRWLKTAFAIGRKHLDYTIESKKDSELTKKIGYDTISPSLSYFSAIEPDRELRWVAFAITGIALLAGIRGGPQPLTFTLYLSVMLVLLAGLWATRSLRRVGYTAIPAAGINILVLQGKQHDTIVSAIEGARKTALLKLSEPAKGVSIRNYLYRLRYLVDTGTLSEEDFIARQKLVLPDESRSMLLPRASAGETLHFHQKRMGVTVDVSLLPDRVLWSRHTLFRGADTSSTLYQNLSEPSSHFETDQQFELTGVIFAWAAAAVMAYAGWLTQGHPAGHYVGGEGLKNAIADYGPSLLLLATAAGIIPMLTRVRYGHPYGNMHLIRDKSYDAIVAAIEERRIAALRARAEPDPLLPFEHQMEILQDLRAQEIISDDEYQQAALRAEFICDNSALDDPVIAPGENKREYALH